MEKGCSCKGEITFGPWGYETGKEWSYRPNKHGGIKQIIIRYGGIIDSIMFKGGDDDDFSRKFGGPGGDRTVKIDIDFPSEYLTGINGTHGSIASFYGFNVCSLTFHTNRNQYGPFGSQNGTGFSSTNAKGVAITGFHGRCSRYLESIGVYIVPHCSLSAEVPKVELGPSSTAAGVPAVPSFLSPPRSAAAIGGSGGREWDDGVFAAVKGVHVRVRTDTGVASAVRFSYLKNDGSDFLSPFHGGYCGGTHRKTILFSEEDEYLIGVEGFYGKVEGVSVIKSMSFITNKAKYGPIGSEMGTYFTTMNSGDFNRKVVGFHGRSGAYLDAIGMHTHYF